MDELKWETRFKVLTQIAAICLIGIYVAGFLVVSIYHLRYGIPGFDFLRPRIISAGVLFSLFLAFPLWELAGIYNWIKIPPKLNPEPESATDMTTKAELTPFWLHIYVPTLKVFLFIGASFGIAFVVSLFTTIDANPVTYAWVLGCSLVSGAAYVLSARLPRRFQAASFGLVLITLPIYTICAWKTHDRSFQLLVLWFLICGMTVRGVLKVKKDPSGFLNESLHMVILNLLLPLAFFAAFIYPRTQPVIGGGAPVPIIIYCTDVPLFAGSTEVKAKLLDETDLGFYLLLSPDDKQAVFLARSAVRAIKFVSQ